MGMIISVVVGIVLTLPISSAAICAAVGISGGAVLAGLADGSVTMEVWNGLALAGGAATAGCCAHMLGFAILSFPDNGVGGFVAQGLGTSMLQVPNLMKKPVPLAPSCDHICNYRTACYLCVPYEKQWTGNLIRNGNFRSGWTDRCCNRMGTDAGRISDRSI